MTTKGSIQVRINRRIAERAADWLSKRQISSPSLLSDPTAFDADLVRLTELVEKLRKAARSKLKTRKIEIDRDTASALVWHATPRQLFGIEPLAVRMLRKQIAAALRKKNWARGRTASEYSVGERQAQRYAENAQDKEWFDAYVASLPPGASLLYDDA